MPDKNTTFADDFWLYGLQHFLDHEQTLQNDATL